MACVATTTAIWRGAESVRLRWRMHVATAGSHCPRPRSSCGRRVALKPALATGAGAQCFAQRARPVLQAQEIADLCAGGQIAAHFAY